METADKMEKIIDQFTYLAQGAFERLTLLATPSSPDALDFVSSGICMTGEEIRANTLSRAYYRHALNACPEMVFILDTNGIITDINETASNRLGYGEGTLPGTALAALSDHPMTRFWLRIPETGTLVLPLRRLCASDGGWVNLRLTASYLPSGWGREREIIVIGQILQLHDLVEHLRWALEASTEVNEQGVLRECLLLCTQPAERLLMAPSKIRLTRRERAILPLLARGLTSGEIGTTLGILEATVNKHRENLRKKFGVHNTVDLVAAARRGKFIK
jgi:PAS domain S-box-containing protein